MWLLQVCSVDCSPLEPNRAVTAGTDRCIKVLSLPPLSRSPVLPLQCPAHALSAVEQSRELALTEFDRVLHVCGWWS